MNRKKRKVLSGIRDKLGIKRDKAKRTFQRGLLVTAAVVTMLGASACGKNKDPHDPWASSTSNQAMASENIPSEKELTESPDSLRFFKGGGWFGNNPDDGIWWNRVSYSMNNLMGGRDILGMGYMDYNAYDGMDIRPANQFLVNPTHIGNVYIEGSNLNELVFDN